MQVGINLTYLKMGGGKHEKHETSEKGLFSYGCGGSHPPQGYGYPPQAYGGGGSYPSSGGYPPAAYPSYGGYPPTSYPPPGYSGTSASSHSACNRITSRLSLIYFLTLWFTGFIIILNLYILGCSTKL